MKLEPILDGRAKRIVLEGRKRDVSNTKVEMHKYFTEVQHEKQRELEDRLMNKEVDWRYKDSDTGQFTKYGDEINPVIERAYRAYAEKKKSYIELDLEELGKVRIDFQKMKECDRSGRWTDVERIDLKEGMIFIINYHAKKSIFKIRAQLLLIKFQYHYILNT